MALLGVKLKEQPRATHHDFLVASGHLYLTLDDHQPGPFMDLVILKALAGGQGKNYGTSVRRRGHDDGHMRSGFHGA